MVVAVMRRKHSRHVCVVHPHRSWNQTPTAHIQEAGWQLASQRGVATERCHSESGVVHQSAVKGTSEVGVAHVEAAHAGQLCVDGLG